MDYETIKKLMDDMGNSKLTAIDIDFPDGMKISMKKEEKKIVVKEDNIQLNEERVQATENSNETVTISKTATDDNKDNTSVADNCNIVTSPMVGTFYLKPDPNSAPYVEVGKKVNKGSTLCIIEAMKLMNEIESEYDGEIVEILVKDGEMVEYGKPLFKIK